MTQITPLFFYAFSFSSGILAWFNPLAGNFTFIFFIAIYILLSYKKRLPIRLIFYFLLSFFIGAFHAFYYQKKQYLVCLKTSQYKRKFTALIIDEKKTESNKTRLTVAIEWPYCFKNQLLFIYLNNQEKEFLKPGLFITFNTKINLTNNKEFNLFLSKENIIGSIFTTSAQLKTYDKITWQSRLIILKNSIKSFATEGMNKLSKKLFETLFLGYKANKNHFFIDTLFKRWGISHFLARSGLHLNIVILTIEGLLLLIPISFLLKQLIIICIILLYFLLSWTTISILRTLVLFLIIKICICIKIPYDFFNMLVFTWAAFLIINPYNILFLDFQLTFILSASIVWFNKQRPKTA